MRQDVQEISCISVPWGAWHWIFYYGPERSASRMFREHIFFLIIFVERSCFNLISPVISPSNWSKRALYCFRKFMNFSRLFQYLFIFAFHLLCRFLIFKFLIIRRVVKGFVVVTSVLGCISSEDLLFQNRKDKIPPKVVIIPLLKSFYMTKKGKLKNFQKIFIVKEKVKNLNASDSGWNAQMK